MNTETNTTIDQQIKEFNELGAAVNESARTLLSDVIDLHHVTIDIESPEIKAKMEKILAAKITVYISELVGFITPDEPYDPAAKTEDLFS